MNKKKALGADPLSWIRPTGDAEGERKPQKIQESRDSTPDKMFLSSMHDTSSGVYREKDKKTPKYESYEIKLTLRLKESQLEFLSHLEREVMKNRSRTNRRERITKNSILRAMVAAFQSLDIDPNEIGDEEELAKRLLKAVSERARVNLPF